MMPLPQESWLSGRNFGKQSVFRWTEECTFRADQKYARAFHGQVVQREAGDEKSHYADFENFRADGDAALAVAIREVAARHGEENEGNREKRANDRYKDSRAGRAEGHRR